MRDLHLRVLQKKKDVYAVTPSGNPNPSKTRQARDIETLKALVEEEGINISRCNVKMVDMGLQLENAKDKEGEFMTEFTVYEKAEDEHDLMTFINHHI